jgi:dienelactone hydrolase
MRTALDVVVIVALWMLPLGASAALHHEVLEYKDGDVTLEGYLVYDDAIEGTRPGVVVFHDWMGLGPNPERRADQLAALGYVALATDMYGKGVRPKDSKEAAAVSGVYRQDRALMRRRAQAGLDVLMKQSLVDTKRVAAIGYCFGGGVALELARSGADLVGVVSFHGTLDTPHPEDAKNIKGSILAMQGADDPFVPRKVVEAFEDEMENAGVDWQMILYGGAVHSFTIPDAGNDPSTGSAYNEKADKRSWGTMRLFFDEIFNRPPRGGK